MTEQLNISIPLTGNERAATGQPDLHMLIKECIAQSRTAQKKLYELYSPAAYGVVKRYLYNDEDAAKEVLNDAFFKIFTKLDQYSFQGAFEGWIRRIVVNTVTDHLRRNMANDHTMKEVQPEDGQVDSTPVGNLSYKELLEVVNTLPEAQLGVFNLFVFENYSHKEIGALLGITENNSRWYLNDARKRLKEKINLLMK